MLTLPASSTPAPLEGWPGFPFLVPPRRAARPIRALPAAPGGTTGSRDEGARMVGLVPDRRALARVSAPRGTRGGRERADASHERRQDQDHHRLQDARRRHRVARSAGGAPDAKDPPSHGAP